ncbi:zinc metallopeptidase [Anabaena sp. CCY 0017]|uniref:zinc metallopeptidase n=1 Tax=Anabaena sp. CCY 0017 TaxID=3103866 RepID=UPI0039C72C6A
MTLNPYWHNFFQELRLKPSLQHQLLEVSLAEISAAEMSRVILRDLGRTDVKVCFTQDHQNCYSPMLNFVGLSKDVANSNSIIAVALAAHEVGHALQMKFMENLGKSFNHLKIFNYLSMVGYMFLFGFKISQALSPFGYAIQRQRQRQSYQWFQKIKLFQLVVSLLLIPITLPLAIFCLVIYTIFMLVSILCTLISRLLIFITEIHASVIGLRLLQQYKILDRKQQNIARKFLFHCALTYLRSSRLYLLFA